MTKRPLDEAYDTKRKVEQDPIGALMAIQQLVGEADTLRAEVARLRSALRTMVYEATHLSQEEDDVSHWCKFTGDALQAARAALAHKEPNQ
tara:strand:- start:2529 stop:2801 length:273 start_codon:yes stop_codon:yes gene_type:complete